MSSHSKPLSSRLSPSGAFKPRFKLNLLLSSAFQRKAKTLSKLSPKAQLPALQKSIELLAQYSTASSTPTSLSGQPFDSHLLLLSSVYRKSRRLYLSMGGRYSATLLSSGRTLSSATLLDNHIEYSPIEQELIWTATDPLEKKAPANLLLLRTYCTSVYHEQNHRILWSLLPPAPDKASDLHRYLNFAESLAIAADLALGDELGDYTAQLFYNTGTIYHPGTNLRQKLGSARNYRNYLQAIIYATYLNLELFDGHEIQQAVQHLYPQVGKFTESALNRSLHLDRNFVEKTNPFWQHKHGKKIIILAKKKNNSKNSTNDAKYTLHDSKNGTKFIPFQNRIDPLQLPSNPLDNRLLYLWAEKWMDKLGLATQ